MRESWQSAWVGNSLVLYVIYLFYIYFAPILLFRSFCLFSSRIEILDLFFCSCLKFANCLLVSNVYPCDTGRTPFSDEFTLLTSKIAHRHAYDRMIDVPRLWSQLSRGKPLCDQTFCDIESAVDYFIGVVDRCFTGFPLSIYDHSYLLDFRSFNIAVY